MKTKRWMSYYRWRILRTFTATVPALLFALPLQAATVQVGAASTITGATLDLEMTATKRAINAKRAASDPDACATTMPGGSVMPACPQALNNAELLVYVLEKGLIFRERANRAIKADTVAECITRFNSLTVPQQNARCANAGLAGGCTAASVCQ